MLKIEKSAFQILSVADNIKKYSPELSDNDIKAFVWYNRTLGIPMTGFEQWFVPNTSDTRVTAKEDVDFLNQQFIAIGKFQKNDPVGKVTRFEHAYNGVNYVAVRQFNGTLCMVDKSKLNTEIEYKVDLEILHSLVKSQSLMYLNGMFLPLHVYTNTDYDTLKRSLDKDKDLITDKFGIDIYEYHKFILSGFVNMRIDHPIKDKRYRLNPYGEISRETKTSYADDDDISVIDAFEKWVSTLKASDFELVSKEDFNDRIIYNNVRVSMRGFSGSEDQKEEQRQQQEKEISDAKLECDRLFSEFCCNVLDHDTLQVLNKKINETYNRSILVNITKVPVGFVSGNMFKAGEFQLKPVQIEAFKFAVSRNNHCLALQVGFGKTSCEIAVLSYMLTTQTVKKPMLVVPKPVMKNWEKELFGYYTDGKQTSPNPKTGYKRHYGILTDCGFEFLNIGNLSKPFISRGNSIRSKKTCIILCSYEALKRMHIADDSIRWFVIDRWMEILTAKNVGISSSNTPATDKAISKQISDLISKLNRIDKDAEISFDKLGIDGLYFDEAHRLKNMFNGVAADKTNRVQTGFSGSPAGRSLRAFYLTQYLQKINGRTGFLTATPFSNSPLEVYTMLCFLNYPELVKNNVNKIQSFVEVFFNETLEYKVNKDNRIVSESVMKNYKNKPILFKILSNTFIYRGNPDEAGIKRPCIIRYPNKEIKLMLRQSVLQTIQRNVLTGKGIDYEYYDLSFPEIIPYIKQFVKKWGDAQTYSRLGMAGKILSSSKSSALSPFSNSPVAMDFITDEPWRELYVYSPKIKFAIDCIYSINKFHENRNEKESGVLVYCGQGINILEPFKKALEKIVGFKRNLSVNVDDEDDDEDIKGGRLTYDEVEIISGSSNNDEEANRRERVGELFNQGRVKVIIGTDTIREGLNLQENCGTLFILTPTWNSTDIQQVEGRIHRQGNSFAFARAITPLVARTLDSFIFQKYDEKTSRLNDIWTDDGISSTENMDVDLKPEKQKELILDDAGEIAKIRAGMLARSEFNALNKIRDEYDSLSLALNDSERYRIAVDFYTQALPKVNEIAANNLLILETILRSINLHTPDYIKQKKARIETLIEYYLDLLEKIQVAINSNLPVDMINIFTGNYKRRGYNLSMGGYYDQKDFEKYVADLGLKNVQNLLVEEIFFSINITAENTEDFIALFSKCAKAEKFILMPEGLSLSSTREELMSIKNKFAQRVMDKEQSIRLNFEIQPKSNALSAKPEYIASLEMTARIELDEENKLAKYGDVLADFFTKKTNIQLTYKPSDIDLKKCDIPYEEVDTDRLSAAFQLDEIQNDHANYKKLYTLLQKVIPAIDTLNAGFYAKSGETGDAIMPLAVEIQQLVPELNAFPDAGPGLALIMEHNYLQNGDLMTDPRIDFALYQKEKMVVPLNYEVNGMGTYFEYVQDKKIIELKGLNDTVKFCYTWFNNLVQQGRIIGELIEEKVEKVGEIPVSNISASKSKTVQDINTIGDEWFIKNPDKILGEMSISDFRNMIIVKGTKEDVINYFDRLFSTPLNEVIKPAPAQTEFTPAEEKLNNNLGSEYKTSYKQKGTDKPIYLRLNDNGMYVGVVYHNAPYGEEKPNWNEVGKGISGPDIEWEEILPVNDQVQADREFSKLSGKPESYLPDYVFVPNEQDNSLSLVKFENGITCNDWLDKLDLSKRYEHFYVDKENATAKVPLGHYAVQKLNNKNFLTKGVLLSNLAIMESRAAEKENKKGLPPEIAALYAEAGTLRFTLSALERQMGSKGLTGNAKKEYNNTKEKLQLIEDRITVYEDSRKKPQPAPKEVIEEKEEIVDLPEIIITTPYANYLIDKIAKKNDKLSVSDIRALKVMFSKYEKDKEIVKGTGILEDIYVANLPVNERPGGYADIRDGFNKEFYKTNAAPEVKLIETDAEKEIRFYNEFVERGMMDNVARMNAANMLKCLRYRSTALNSLHTGNKNLRAVWMKETGVKLPDTESGTQAAIKKYFDALGNKELVEPVKEKPAVKEFKNEFTLYLGDPMRRGKAIKVLEKSIRDEKGKVVKIHEWIESFPLDLEIRRNVKFNSYSERSKKGYTESDVIGDHIVETETEVDYYQYLVDGGYSYSAYLNDKKEFDAAQAVIKQAEKEKEDIETAERNLKNYLQSEAAKNKIIKDLLENGMGNQLQKQTTTHYNLIADFTKKRQTKDVLEQIAKAEKNFEWAKHQLIIDYGIAKELFILNSNGEVEKKYDWKVGDAVLYAVGYYDKDEKRQYNLIPTTIIEIKDGTVIRPFDKTYKVELKNGIPNQYAGYTTLRPLEEVKKPLEPKVEKEPKIEKPKEPAPKKEKTPAQQRVFINEQIKALNLVIKYSADKKEKSVINDQIKALKIALKYI